MQMIDLMKRLAELDARNPNVVKEGASQLVPGKFYVVTGGRFRGSEKAVAGPFDDDGEAEYEKAEYSQGGKGDAAVAQWTNNGWNFDYMMEQGVAEGSPGDYTFTTALNGMLGDDKEFEVTYHYSKGEAPRGYGSLPSDGSPASVEIISVKDLETGQDVSVKNVGKNIWAEFEEEAWYDYKENQQHNNFQDPEYDRDDRYESLAECGMMGGGMSQPRSPASINMTAASGEELSAMLKDIMTLAGRPMQEPMGGQEPVGGANGVAVVDVGPSDGMDADPGADVDMDEPSIMRSMIDKLNPSGDDEMGDDDEEEIKTDETINSLADPMPHPVPPGNQDPAGHRLPKGDRGQHTLPRAFTQEVTYESLMADYHKFIAESEQGVAEGSRTAKPGEHTPLNDPARIAAAKAQREKMAAYEKAKPGQALLKKIDNKK